MYFRGCNFLFFSFPSQKLWRHHPLGAPLLSKIFSSLESTGDIQTLAVMSCVLQSGSVTNPAEEDNESRKPVASSPVDVPPRPAFRLSKSSDAVTTYAYKASVRVNVLVVMCAWPVEMCVCVLWPGVGPGYSSSGADALHAQSAAESFVGAYGGYSREAVGSAHNISLHAQGGTPLHCDATRALYL